MKQVPGYTLVRTEDCPEQHGTLTVLTHDVSGATTLLVEKLKTATGTEVPEIELVGLCTGICVLSNAILCKATFPESDVSVDAACCACVTPQSHDTALSAMKLCQIDINNQGSEPWRP